jgi:hypothetical protein
MNWKKVGVLANVGCLAVALVTLEILVRRSGVHTSAWSYVPIVLLSVGLVLSGWFNWRVYQATNSFPVRSSKMPEKLGDILFDYLPQESPFQHGWKLSQETKATPAFSPPIGLSIIPSKWYRMDYLITDAREAGCNRLRFVANFGTDGRIYTMVQMPSNRGGHKPQERWIQLGVNIGPPYVDLNWDEGVVSISGKPLGGGWELFDILLDDTVKDSGRVSDGHARAAVGRCGDRAGARRGRPIAR